MRVLFMGRLTCWSKHSMNGYNSIALPRGTHKGQWGGEILTVGRAAGIRPTLCGRRSGLQ